MASSFTARLRYEKQADGENSNTWGGKVNVVFDLIDEARAGYLSKSVAGSSDVTLTANNSATDENRQAVLEFTGTLTGSINVIVSTVENWWLIKNSTAGAFTLTVKTSAGSGIVVTQGEWAILYCDGTDVLESLVGVTLLADTTPQLGGFLDPNGQFIGRDKGGDIASASPLVIDTDGDYFDITGIAGFSAMTVATNRSFVLQFDGILTITVGSGITLNNAGNNYTTAAGDIIVCQSTAANTITGWIVKADGTAVVVTAAALSRSYLAGLVLSNGTDATNDIDIAIGEARSTADDSDLAVAAAIGKQIDVTFAAGGTPGAPTGGRSSTVALTNDTTYHIILGLVSGTAEIGFDTSITGANLATDHSFTNIRRIGAVMRGTATNLAFTQTGDRFLLDDPPGDVDVSNQGTSAITRALTVPLGVKVKAEINLFVGHASVQATLYARSPDQNDEAPGSSPPFESLRATSTTTGGSSRMELLTGTSSDITTRSDQTSVTLRIALLGWVDRRGRDD